MIVGTDDRTSHSHEGLYAAAAVAGPLVEHQRELHSRSRSSDQLEVGSGTRVSLRSGRRCQHADARR
jgi:hypothetical protein